MKLHRHGSSRFLHTFLLINLFLLPALFALFAMFSSSLQAADPGELVFAFRNYSTDPPARMLLVGEIRSKSRVPEPSRTDSPFLNYDTRPDQVTVKLVNRKGLKVGQKLYVIDKDPFHKEYRNGLIVGEITVSTIFHSPFYGWALTGTGILLRVREGQFVARTLETENLERAFVLKKRGDHFVHEGNIERAIASYNEALNADNALPEAHAAMGSIFLKLARRSGEEPVRSLSEFEQAWKYRLNFQYRYEEFRFYREFMEALEIRYAIRSRSASREENVVRILDRIREVGAQALAMDPKQPEIIIQLFRTEYLRMEYYRGRSNPEERKNYDASLAKAGEYLLSLLVDPVSETELHRTSVLFYGHILSDLQRGDVSVPGDLLGKLYNAPVYRLHRASEALPSAQNPEDRLKELIRYHADKYYRFQKRGGEKPDPSVLEIWRSLE